MDGGQHKLQHQKVIQKTTTTVNSMQAATAGNATSGVGLATIAQQHQQQQQQQQNSLSNSSTTAQIISPLQNAGAGQPQQMQITAPWPFWPNNIQPFTQNNIIIRGPTDGTSSMYIQQPATHQTLQQALQTQQNHIIQCNVAAQKPKHQTVQQQIQQQTLQQQQQQQAVAAANQQIQQQQSQRTAPNIMPHTAAAQLRPASSVSTQTAQNQQNLMKHKMRAKQLPVRPAGSNVIKTENGQQQQSPMQQVPSVKAAATAGQLQQQITTAVAVQQAQPQPQPQPQMQMVTTAGNKMVFMGTGASITLPNGQTIQQASAAMNSGDKQQMQLQQLQKQQQVSLQQQQLSLHQLSLQLQQQQQQQQQIQQQQNQQAAVAAVAHQMQLQVSPQTFITHQQQQQLQNQFIQQQQRDQSQQNLIQQIVVQHNAQQQQQQQHGSIAAVPFTVSTSTPSGITAPGAMMQALQAQQQQQPLPYQQSQTVQASFASKTCGSIPTNPVVTIASQSATPLVSSTVNNIQQSQQISTQMQQEHQQQQILATIAKLQQQQQQAQQAQQLQDQQQEQPLQQELEQHQIASTTQSALVTSHPSISAAGAANTNPLLAMTSMMNAASATGMGITHTSSVPNNAAATSCTAVVAAAVTTTPDLSAASGTKSIALNDQVQSTQQLSEQLQQHPPDTPTRLQPGTPSMNNGLPAGSTNESLSTLNTEPASHKNLNSAAPPPGIFEPSTPFTLNPNEALAAQVTGALEQITTTASTTVASPLTISSGGGHVSAISKSTLTPSTITTTTIKLANKGRHPSPHITKTTYSSTSVEPASASDTANCVTPTCQNENKAQGGSGKSGGIRSLETGASKPPDQQVAEKDGTGGVEETKLTVASPSSTTPNPKIIRLEKDLPKAMIKPNVLSHVIDGFIIQEANEPFPVTRQRYLDVKDPDEYVSDALVGSASAKRRKITNGTAKNHSQPQLSMSTPLHADLPACEHCGKQELKTKLKRKRFCSPSCARQAKAAAPPHEQPPSAIRNGSCISDIASTGASITTKSTTAATATATATSTTSSTMTAMIAAPGTSGSNGMCVTGYDQSREMASKKDVMTASSTTIDVPPETVVTVPSQSQIGTPTGMAEISVASSTGLEAAVAPVSVAASDVSVVSNGLIIAEPTPSGHKLLGSNSSNGLAGAVLTHEMSLVINNVLPQTVAAQVLSSAASSTDLVKISDWTVAEVCNFIKKLPGCCDYVEEFEQQEIDGQALLLLKESHLVNTIGMKLGPALKVVAKVEQIKEETAANQAERDQQQLP